MNKLDRYVLGQIAQPAFARLRQSLGLSAFAISRLAFLASAACAAVGMLWLWNKDEDGSLLVLTLTCGVEAVRRVRLAILVSSWEEETRIASVNPRLESGFVSRLAALAMFVCVLCLVALLRPPFGDPVALAWMIGFASLAAVAEYAAASHRPPR